jgi:hypothetical protein
VPTGISRIPAISSSPRPSRWWRAREPAGRRRGHRAEARRDPSDGMGRAPLDAVDTGAPSGISRTCRRRRPRTAIRAVLTTIRWSHASNREASRSSAAAAGRQRTRPG